MVNDLEIPTIGVINGPGFHNADPEGFKLEAEDLPYWAYEYAYDCATGRVRGSDEISFRKTKLAASNKERLDWQKSIVDW